MKKTSNKKIKPMTAEKKYSGPKTSLMISKKYSLEKIQNERIIDFCSWKSSKTLLIRKKDVSRRHEIKTSELSIKESNIHVIKPHEAKLMFLFLLLLLLFCFPDNETKQWSLTWGWISAVSSSRKLEETAGIMQPTFTQDICQTHR